jgi:L-ornithine Nalpha-acyltransferase
MTVQQTGAAPKIDKAHLACSGPLEARLATTRAEIEAVQRLRFEVFYREMSAEASPEMAATGRDFDRYDEFADLLYVLDHAAPDAEGKPPVIGTYRLLRREVAMKHGGFYTSSEYDISKMLATARPDARYLELGRSCVLKTYRTSAPFQFLWRGLMVYLLRHNIELMFGCASLPGTDPQALALQLSYLHHFCPIPEAERVRARPELYVDMNLMPKDQVNEAEALRTLPPLVKGYVRAGASIGDGAVIDRQFGTTDVFIYFPISRLDPRYLARFKKGIAETA